MPRARFNPLKAAVLVLWLFLFAAAFSLWWRSSVPLSAIPLLLHRWLESFGLGRAALLYILFYVARPLVLFPATFLTISSGLLFGPWLGVLFTVVGENFSANFAFLLARWLGRGAVASHERGLLRQWETRLRDNGIVAVMIMRLLFLPFDAVNFGCGLTGMRQCDYAIGTFFGIFPGIVAVVLLGGAEAAGVHRRFAVLGLSLVCFCFAVGIAFWLRRRGAATENETRS